MKTRSPFILLIAGVLVIAVVILFLRRPLPPAGPVVAPVSENHPATNSNPTVNTNLASAVTVSVATNQTVEQKANAPLVTNDLQQVVVNQQSGQYAVINPDQKAIILKDKDGNTIWTADVLAALGTTPIFGARTITAMQYTNDSLWVTIGRHSYASIDINTGKVTPFGSD